MDSHSACPLAHTITVTRTTGTQITHFQGLILAGLLRSQRDLAIARRKGEGLTPMELATEFNMSIRSIYRVLGGSATRAAA